MAPPRLHKTHRHLHRPNFELTALVLQGGGALGAYQAGVYEAMAEANLSPDWLAGISIGSINSAIIAGNPPKERVARLRSFWERVTGSNGTGILPALQHSGDTVRSWANQYFAGIAVMKGAEGFFLPRPLSPWLAPQGTLAATSYYECSPLKATLAELIDFDRLNHGETRLSVGAVNVRSGNFVYFDTTTHPIGVEHIMASGALPPGFPPVEIEGEYYWDGGMVSNTPLSWVLDTCERQDSLIFQVDLWPARGDVPANMAQVATRQKEIQYSSRTRAASAEFRRRQRARNAIADLMKTLTPEQRATVDYEALGDVSARKVFNLVQLIYRSRTYEGDSKDYDFSRQSMEEHWRAGYNDAARTLRHPEVLMRPENDEGVFIFDLMVDGGE